MSRPHDGQRTFLPFRNPFRMILPKGSYLSPKLLALMTSFEQNLVESLRKLKPKENSDVLRLSWMRQAIESLSETHANIKTLITDLQLPVSEWDEKWMDMYLDSSVKLLDICIALSSEISRLDQGQLLLQYVLHILDFSGGRSPSSEQLRRAHASLCDWMQQINCRSPKLENCTVILQCLAGTLYSAKVKNSAKGKVLMRALYGVKVETVFVCSVITAALSGCPELLIELHIPDKFIWAHAFHDLQTNVIGEVQSQLSQGKAMIMKEVEAVKKCVEKLNLFTSSDCGHKDEEILQQTNGVCHMDVVTLKKTSHEAETLQRSNGACHMEIVTLKNKEGEGLQESVSELAESTERLAHELDLLAKQVDGFFQIVLTGRDALLCNLRVPDAEQEWKIDVRKL